MHNTIRGLALGALLVAGPLPAAQPGGWFNVGYNVSSVTESEHNCGGGQAGLSLGNTVMVRGQYTHVSFEADDDTDTCDGGFWGDADAGEWAGMLGVALGRSGLFVAGGLAGVDFEANRFGPYGEDTGSRVELGWSAKLAHNWPVGVEIVAFRTDTDIRDYHGVAVNASFGPRGRAPAKRRAAGATRF